MKIKFRAFDDGKMLYSHNNITNTSNFQNKWFFERIREDAIVMQYTGLEDSHGKEIYEGDILREIPKNDWEKLNYSCFEVFFHDGDCNTDYNIGFSMNRMYNHGSICGGIILPFKPRVVSCMIIIGNIYENPNLLNP